MRVFMSTTPVLELENGALVAIGCGIDGQRPLSVEIEGCTITSLYMFGSIRDTIEPIGPSCFSMKRTWSLESGSYRLCASFKPIGLADSQAFVPAAYYQGNVRGKGSYPNARISEHWEFLETRSAIPAAVCLYDSSSTFCMGMRASWPHASSTWKDGSIVFHIPGFEAPFSYKGKSLLERQDGQGLTMKVDAPVSRTFIGSFSSKSLLAGYEEFIQAFSSQVEPAERLDPESLADKKALLLRQLLSLVRLRGDEEAYLVMGCGNGSYQDIYEFTAGSFLVKSLEAAAMLASLDVQRILDEASDPIKDILQKELDRLEGLGLKDLARRIARFFFRAERAPGVFQDCHDLRTGEWGGYLGVSEHPEYRDLVNARCNGEAMMGYLRLYESLKDEEYLELALRVASFYLKAQCPDGSFGRWWSVDMKPVNRDGTNGAYILSFLCRLYSIRPSDEIKAAIEKAADYYASLIESGLFYGDTLDADSCDKEAGEALLGAMLSLLESPRFSSSRYLEAAKKATSFLLSWIWQDDLVFKASTPLGKRGFHTRGMTSASIANQHLDDYGMMIANDLIRLDRLCPRALYKDQARLMVSSALQLMSSPKDTLGRSSDYYGWQPEQMNHTSWDYFNDIARHDGWFSIHIAWVNVLVLDYLEQNLELGSDMLLG